MPDFNPNDLPPNIWTPKGRRTLEQYQRERDAQTIVQVTEGVNAGLAPLVGLDGQTLVGMTEHLAATDPHGQYTTDAEATALADAEIALHEAAADPHPDYTDDAEATAIADAEIAAHEAASDPHPDYTTTSEVLALLGGGTGGTDHEHMVDVFAGDGAATTFELTDEPSDPEAVVAFVAGAETAVTISGPMNTTATFGVAPGAAARVTIMYPAVAA